MRRSTTSQFSGWSLERAGSYRPGEQCDRLNRGLYVLIREKLRQRIEIEVYPAKRDFIALQEVPRSLGGRLPATAEGSPRLA